MNGQEILDWSTGTEGIAYERCDACGQVWYLSRKFCAACGSLAVMRHQASGTGLVVTTTVVSRPPNDKWKEYAPYTLALIDADEGFRIMAHVESGARIGDRVLARFLSLEDPPIPVFMLIDP